MICGNNLYKSQVGGYGLKYPPILKKWKRNEKNNDPPFVFFPAGSMF